MKRRTVAVLGALGLTLGALIALGANTARKPQAPPDQIRSELMQMPYYGIFDFLSFKYNESRVTLMGYAYRETLKRDVERTLLRVPGVKTIDDQVDVLPISASDDNLRWQTYWAVYGDPFLSHYAPGSDTLWGHRHELPFGFLPLAPGRFPGTEPAGDYPIHIIVNKGHITLMGVVDRDSDKTIAGTKARSVTGSVNVDNELVVEHWTSATK